MKKITFTSEQKEFIKNEFYKGTLKNQILNDLKDKFNIKCGLNTLTNLYKELGINGNTKIDRGEVKPWHEVFTNNYFPDKITNCILLDLFVHYTYEEISKLHHMSVSEITKRIKPYDNGNPFDLWRIGKSVYYMNKMHMIKNHDLRQTDKSLRREMMYEYKEDLIPNYEIEIFGDKYIFDFYCPKTNTLILCGFNNTGIINTINDYSKYFDVNFNARLIRSNDIDKQVSLMYNIINNIKIKPKKLTKEDYKEMEENIPKFIARMDYLRMKTKLDDFVNKFDFCGDTEF